MPLNGAVHSFGSGHYKTFFQHWAKKSSLIKKASFTYDHMSFENRVRGDFFIGAMIITLEKKQVGV